MPLQRIFLIKLPTGNEIPPKVHFKYQEEFSFQIVLLYFPVCVKRHNLYEAAKLYVKLNHLQVHEHALNAIFIHLAV